MSIYMLDRGLMPAGALLAGISAHFIGAPATGLMGFAVFCWQFFWRGACLSYAGSKYTSSTLRAPFKVQSFNGMGL
jgi:hypothetical protein